MIKDAEHSVWNLPHAQNKSTLFLFPCDLVSCFIMADSWVSSRLMGKWSVLLKLVAAQSSEDSNKFFICV